MASEGASEAEMIAEYLQIVKSGGAVAPAPATHPQGMEDREPKLTWGGGPRQNGSATPTAIPITDHQKAIQPSTTHTRGCRRTRRFRKRSERSGDTREVGVRDPPSRPYFGNCASAFARAARLGRTAIWRTRLIWAIKDSTSAI
jgi:hypothetical protein